MFIDQVNQTDDSLFEDDGEALKERMINSDLNGDNGDFGEFLMSMMQDGGSSNNHGKRARERESERAT